MSSIELAPSPLRPRRSGMAAVWPEVIRGALDMVPYAAGLAPFALIVGATIAENPHPGPGLAATWLLYGGSVHLAVLRLFEEGAGTAAIVVTGLLVNARLLIYSTSVAPMWRDESRRFVALAAAVLVEPTWTLARARQERPGSAADRRRHYVGAGLTLWLAWSALVLTGMLVGARAGSALGLDLAVPLCLLGVVVPTMRQRPGLAAAVTGAVVAVVARGLPAGTAILLAAVAGFAAARLADREAS